MTLTALKPLIRAGVCLAFATASAAAAPPAGNDSPRRAVEASAHRAPAGTSGKDDYGKGLGGGGTGERQPRTRLPDATSSRAASERGSATSATRRDNGSGNGQNGGGERGR